MPEEVVVELKVKIKNFSRGPGVYIMKDSAGAVIYVGKTLSLRNRVRSYFAGGDGRSQIEFLMRRVASIETIVSHTEEQALIMERDLIRKFKPRYNIMLKDDKAFLSVRIDDTNPWPKLELVRKVPNDGATYYGPYSSSSELRALLELIKSVVPLRSCNDTVFNNRQRPCLEYEIKRCAGPCCLAVDRNDYRRWLKQAERILQGKSSGVKADLEREMQLCSDAMNFEEAAVLRDRIALLERYSAAAQITSHRGEDRDVFATYREGSLASLAILMVRGGRVVNSRNFVFEEVSAFDAEILESALLQYYEAGNDVPPEILVSLELESSKALASRLNQISGNKVEISAPSRGLKYRLITLAELNAKQNFIEKFNAEDRVAETSKELMKRFNLKQAPRRLECIDISNFQGDSIVASLVSFFDGRPDKERYRHYNISFQGKPDDFAAIAEVTERRLKGGREREDLPDLLVIDGGQGQLGAALSVRDALGIDLDIISLAKSRAEFVGKKERAAKPERVFTQSSNDAITLVIGEQITQLLTAMRDEAHRFAITFHRKKRSKKSFASVLDNISGLTPESKDRLLKRYGSVAAIGKLSAEELVREGRLPSAVAKRVVEALKH